MSPQEIAATQSIVAALGAIIAAPTNFLNKNQGNIN